MKMHGISINGRTAAGMLVGLLVGLSSHTVAAAQDRVGRMRLGGAEMSFERGSTQSTQFTMTAVGAPVEILQVLVPTSADAVVRVRNVDCPVSPNVLPAGGTCSAEVTSNGMRAIDVPLTVKYAGGSGVVMVDGRIRVGVKTR